MMKMKRVLTALLMIVLLMICLLPASAAGGITITRHPEDRTVVEGGSCTFTAAGKGHTGITWRLCSTDGTEDFPFTNAADHFPGLRVSGKNSNKLTLKNIPGEMDGWLVYCVYSTKTEKVPTDAAILRVTDRSGNPVNGTGMPARTPAPGGMHDGSAVLPADGELVLRTYGCYIQFVDDNGNAKGESFTELNFGESYYNSLTRRNVTNGVVHVRITADVPRGRTVEYWVINGIKYTFNTQVKSFTLREVTYGMTIEAVLDGDTPRTLRTEAASAPSGTLLVESKGARMFHVDERGKSAGRAFTEFDFTNDYVNQATDATVPGGRVTVRVAAVIPKGMVVTFWRFNGARINFNSDVTSFIAEDLRESMVYQAVFYTKTTPVPEYTITCKNCTFSGGGYTNAKSGTVPYGTQITIKPQGNSSLGWWSGTHKTGEVSDKSVTWIVKDNCSFEWHMIVN